MKKNIRPKTASEKSNVNPETLLLQKASLKKLPAVMATICAVLGFFLYINTLGHDYTVDDNTVMQKNKIVTRGVSAIPEIFTTSYRKGFWDRQESLYRPLSLTMFAIEWQLAPGKPFVGHLVNIILYALTGFVLFITLRLVLSKFNLLIPFAATLLFMAHPLHTEVVASIKSRDELLGFLFLVLSVYFLFTHCKSEAKKILPLILSAACFLLALLSKESALTFIAVFPLALYFFTDFDLKKIIRYALLFIIPLVVYFGLRYNALHAISNYTEILPINNSLVKADNAASRLATAITIIGKYVGLLLFPHPLSFDYSYNQIPNVSFADGMALLWTLVFGALAIFAFRTFGKKNILSFCVLYFFITISLVSNIVIMIESTMAERFLYTSSLAFCIALPVLFLSLFKLDRLKTGFYNWKTFFSMNKSIPVSMILVLLLYSFKTISRNADWKDNYTLLKRDVKSAPNSARIRYAFGTEILLNRAMVEKDPLKKPALLQESVSQLEKGVEILGTYGEAFFHLGLAYNELQDYGNAVRSFENAKRSKKWDDPSFYASSGLAYGLAKQFDKAFPDFEQSVKLDSTEKETFNNWGLILTDAGNPREALIKLSKANELDPKFASAWYNKGNAYAQLGEFQQAISSYEKAIALDPPFVDALTNIGNCYAATKDIPKAIETFEKALSIEPGNYKAITNLAVSYHQIGNEEKSLEYQKMLAGRK